MTQMPHPKHCWYTGRSSGPPSPAPAPPPRWIPLSPQVAEGARRQCQPQECPPTRREQDSTWIPRTRCPRPGAEAFRPPLRLFARSTCQQFLNLDSYLLSKKRVLWPCQARSPTRPRRPGLAAEGTRVLRDSVPRC